VAARCKLPFALRPGLSRDDLGTKEMTKEIVGGPPPSPPSFLRKPRRKGWGGTAVVPQPLPQLLGSSLLSLRSDTPTPYPTSPLPLSLSARLRPFFGFACFLRPGVPVPADEDGHREAAPAPSFISPGWDAHLSSRSCPSLLPFPVALPLNLLSSLVRVAMARCGPCGRGRR